MDRTFELRDELNSILTDAESYVVPNDHDLNNEDPGQLLEGRNALKFLRIQHPTTERVFQALWSL